MTFAAAPLVLTPFVRNQGNPAVALAAELWVETMEAHPSTTIKVNTKITTIKLVNVLFA